MTTTTTTTTIRHSGTVHVRGRIRRVWRPRYFELQSDGRLRLSVRTTTTSLSSVLLVPKYILCISSARILDGTTLRDLHVGLPRGTFGFVVRGYRLPTERQQTTVKDEKEEEGEEIVTRDYFCAVETLEEAQMWVVALQWAASITPYHNNSTTKNTDPTWWKIDYEDDSNPESAPILHSSPPQGQWKKTKTKHSVPQTTTTSCQANTILVSKISNTRIVRVAGSRDRTWKWDYAYEIHLMLLSNINNNIQQSNSSNTTPTTIAEQWVLLRTAHQFQEFYEKHIQTTITNMRHQHDQFPQIGLNDRPNGPNEMERSILILDKLLRKWILSVDLVNSKAFHDFLGFSAQPDCPTTIPSPSKWCWWSWNGPVLDTDWTSCTWVLSRRTETINESRSNLDAYVKQWLVQCRHRNSSSSDETTFPYYFLQAWQQVCLQWWMGWRWRWGKGRTSGNSRTASTVCSSDDDDNSNIARKEPSRYMRLQNNYYYSIGGAVLMATSVPLARFLWRRMGEVVIFELPKISVRVDMLVVSWIGAAYIGNQWHSIGVTSKRHATNAYVGSSAALLQRHKSVHTEATTKKNSKQHRKAEIPMTTGVQNDATITPPDAQLEDEFADFVSTSSHDAWADDDHDNEDDDESEEDGEEMSEMKTVAPSPIKENSFLPSPLPLYPKNGGVSCWSQPRDDQFYVRGRTYFHDKVKVPSGSAPFQCRGVDIWLTDNPERHIARHPAVLGGKLHETDTFLVNFLLPFGNFVAYFEVCPLNQFPSTLRDVWTQFLRGDQQYRDARLKLLPIVVEGPWIVKTAVGPGKSPALLGKVIPLQYYFQEPKGKQKGIYEVDVIITASTIAKGILNIVKSQTNSVTIAFAFIIEAAEQQELPENVLCSFQIHSINLEYCPYLPKCDLNDDESM